jgi:L-ascorbate metabolism protein UlaG (beta-lactamase superfamily)
MFFSKYPASKALLALGLFLSPCAAADVTITQLANGGVIFSDGETRVMIDGMVVEPYSVYAGLPPDAAADFSRASGAFAGIDLVLASHRHHDHNQPASACSFVQNSDASILVTSAEVISLVRERCRDFVTTTERIEVIDPQPGEPVIVEVGNARVSVFRLSHGKQKYSRIENFAHLVELGGLRLLHIGDAAMDGQAFDEAGLGGEAIDVAFIPIWFFQPGPGETVIRSYLDAPYKFAVQVPPDEAAEARSYLAEKFPGVRLLDTMEETQLTPPPEKAPITP